MKTIGIKFSPSAAERWMTCTASVKAIENEPQPPYSKYADEGVVAHKVFETYWAGDGSPLPGSVYPEHPKHPVTAEMVTCALGAGQYLEQVLEAHPAAAEEIFSEKRMSIPLPAAANGVVDFAARKGSTLFVADYKYGKGVKVSVQNNPQMMLYAAAMLAEMSDGVEAIEMHVLQPRLNHYSAQRLTVDEMRVFLRAAAAAVHAALGPDPVFAPSVGACRWCPIKNTCSARAQAAYTAVSSQFSFDGSTPTAFKDQTQLTPEQVAAIGHDIPHIREWCHSIETKLRELVEDALHKTGTAVAYGWKLKQGRATRAWLSDKDALKAFRRAKLKAGDYTVKSYVSPPQAEKVAGKRVYDEKIAPAVTVSSSKPSLVPEGDSGQPLSQNSSAKQFGLDNAG